MDLDSSDDDNDLFRALSNSEPCANCGKPNASMICTNGCKTVYCTTFCRLNHATTHRLRCRNLRYSKFNDDSSDDSEDEEEDEEESSSSEEEVVVRKKKKKSKKKAASQPLEKATASSNPYHTMHTEDHVSSETERRIEEKIMKRLEKQEHARQDAAVLLAQSSSGSQSTPENAQARKKNSGVTVTQTQAPMPEAPPQLQPAPSYPASRSPASPNRAVTPPPVPFQAQAPSYAQSQQGFADNPRFAPQTRVISPHVAPIQSQFQSQSQSQFRETGQSASPGAEDPWTNTSEAFARVRIVVLSDAHYPGFSLESGSCIVMGCQAPETAHLGRGDVLSSINGFPVTPDNVQHLLQTSKKPAICRFRAPMSAHPRVMPYEVEWMKGALGLTLKDDGSAQAIPIVHRFTQAKEGVTLTTAQRNGIGVGDILVAINNIDTVALGCTLTMSVLKKVRLPATLSFRRSALPLSRTPDPVAPSPSNGQLIGNGHSSGPSMTARDSYGSVHRSSNGSQSQLGKSSVSQSQPPYRTSEESHPPLNPSNPRGSGGGGTTQSQLRKNSVSLAEQAQLRSRAASPQRAASPPRALLPSHQYTVRWADGPLGLTIIPGEFAGEYPVIKRVTGKGASLDLQQCQVGDTLCQIGTTSIAALHFDFDAIVSVLKSIPKPVTLIFTKRGMATQEHAPPQRMVTAPPQRMVTAPPQEHPFHAPFKHPPSVPLPASKASNYTILWQEGPLGLTLDLLPHDAPGAYIKRMTEGTGAAAAAQLTPRVVGDTLVSINGVNVTRCTFTEIVQQLTHVVKPATLEFCRARLITSTPNPPTPSFSNPPNPGHPSNPVNPLDHHLKAPANPGQPLDQPLPISTQIQMNAAPTVVSSSSGLFSYRIIWEDGMGLGLSLHAGDTDTSAPYIRRLTGTGSSARLTSEVLGDELIAINDMAIASQTFVSVMERLKVLSKPLSLTFQRPSAGTRIRRGSSDPVAREAEEAARLQGGKMAPVFGRTRRDSAPSGPSSPTMIPSTASAMTVALADHDSDDVSKYSALHTPFLGKQKLSSRRHQRIVQSVKK